MTNDKKTTTEQPTPATGPRKGGARKELPGWTSGLRELYDKVVDEELPDSFRDLLSRLDETR